MDKSEKVNIIIAGVLCVGAVAVLYYLRTPGAANVVYQNSGATLPATSVAGDAANVPGYTSYNVPPYNPGALPPITTTVTGGALDASQNAALNIGSGCCPGCAGETGTSTTTDISKYLGIMGLGSLAGAA